MAARFEVHEAFPIRSRGLFAVAGAIREGMVHAGMTAALEGREDAFSRTVHSVEVLDRAAGQESEARPCLTFHFRDEERLVEWTALDWSDTKLVLTW